MSVHLIELQDHALCIRTQDGLLARAPGVANIAGGKPVFGDAARQQARLHPREHFNQFWLQLNLDPLVVKNKFFRNAADLAHRQLAELTQGVAMPEGAVLAAPGFYTRQQLAVLLGIVRQCSFAATGLVDLALLQAAGSDADECVVIDLQLHHAVLSRFRHSEGFLVKEQTVTVPFAGLNALHEAWTSLITEEFILQSRFDPLHTAETDQYVYDRLEQWLAATRDNDKVLLDINMKGVVHQATLTRAQFDQRAQTVYQRIARELAPLRGEATALHVRASQFELPGLMQNLPGVSPLADDVAMATCVQHFDYIKRDPDKLQFVTKLPVAATAPRTTAPAPRQPTHVLFRHRALPLTAGRVLFGTAPTGVDAAQVLPATGFAGGAALVHTGGGIQLELHTQAPVLCNDLPARHGQALVLGDVVRLGRDVELQLILVEQHP